MTHICASLYCRSALDTLASRVAELTLQLQGKPDAAALTTKADLSALDALTQQLAAVAEASGRTLPVIIAPTSGQAPVSDESGKHALTQLRDLHAAQGQFNTRLDELWKLYGDLQQSVAAAAAATRVLPPVAVAAAAAAADAAPAAAVQAAVVAIEQYDDAALRGVVAQMSAQLHALTQALQGAVHILHGLLNPFVLAFTRQNGGCCSCLMVLVLLAT